MTKRLKDGGARGFKPLCMAANMAMLYEAAALGWAVRRMFREAKDHPDERYFTYVLLLQQGKLYVGSTDNVYARLADHFACNRSSALWVREYGPPVRVVEIIRNSPPGTESYKYCEYADKFGYENVRGGGWCRLVQRREPASVRNFTYRQTEFDHLSRSEIEDVVDKVTKLI